MKTKIPNDSKTQNIVEVVALRSLSKKKLPCKMFIALINANHSVFLIRTKMQ